jgi:hypothetical protein
MATEKDLLLKVLESNPEAGFAASFAQSFEELEELESEIGPRFKLGRNEYLVLTESEALELGYKSGGLSTSDENLKVYRIR